MPVLPQSGIFYADGVGEGGIVPFDDKKSEFWTRFFQQKAL